MRIHAAGLAITLLFAAGLTPCKGADLWGGSLALTSDYVVRGISRSDRDPAVQLDVHYLSSSGFLAGVFASNTQFEAEERKDAELDAFLGYAWSAAGDWHGRALLSHYAYPWNARGAHYDYDEIEVDVAHADWLSLSASYSPDAPRYIAGYGLAGVGEESAEVDVQHRLYRKLSAAAGAGYARYGGAYGTGYGYFSAALTYDLAPVSVTLSYVNTTEGAKALFYNEAERGRAMATVIWRF